MNIDPNDPRLTAFVLGELDPTERADVEALIIDSADCRQAVEEIRLTAQWLSEQLHEESKAHFGGNRAQPPGRSPRACSSPRRLLAVDRGGV